MLAELASQQKAEYAKWETCKKDIDTTEDKIWNGKVGVAASLAGNFVLGRVG